MALAIVYSRASSGITAPLVSVEVHISNGMAGLHIVGLPEKAVKESKDRVRSALINSQFEFPCRHITINLAPADLPKEGGRFDLPIALGILAASKQIPGDKLASLEFAGELALSGELRPLHGVLPLVLSAYRAKRQLIIPYDNALEASLVPHANVLSAQHLLEVCAYLKQEKTLSSCLTPMSMRKEKSLPDLADVKGQLHAKRALEITAAGRHSLLFIGPPGTGKTMLASRLSGILPDISEEQALEIAAIASVSSDGFDMNKWKSIPFRSPHHSSSSIAIVGGGRPPKPGEISLAHHGILFLDELPEFGRQVLECLREPFEAGQVTISRSAHQAIFPAKFQFIAAMNPCPCGFAGSPADYCRCTSEQIQRYLSKISGPLLDRIDMHVEVSRVSSDVISTETISESSAQVRERVIRAYQYQQQRQAKQNAALSVPELCAVCVLDKEARLLLNQAMEKFHLSARGYHRIIKVARTIADLDETPVINIKQLSEALHFRCLDRLKLA